MVQKSFAKITALAFLVWALFHSVYVLPFAGLSVGSPLFVRLAYPFFHAGMFHALLNAWCFLSIAFLLPTSIGKLLTAYIIAVSVPDVLLPAMPLMGLSGVCYALLGLFSFSVRDKMKWQWQIWATILIGLLFPNIAVGVHAYCFAVGTLVAFVNYPCFNR